MESVVSFSQKQKSRELDESETIEVDCPYFSNYKHKWMGKEHPVAIQEGTALGWVKLPEVDIKLVLPKHLYNSEKENKLSGPQIESILLARAAHQKFLANGSRQGFLIGDAPGLGKTRIAAAIILDTFWSNEANNRAIWFTKSEQLFDGIQLEFKELESNVRVFSVAEQLKSRTGTPRNSVICSTYDWAANREEPKTLISAWMGKDYDGLIVFDEAHFGKSSTSAAAKTIVEIQNENPKAYVVYATATSAYRPSHFFYLERLGIWESGTCFEDKEEFNTKMEKIDEIGFEMLALKLKERGVYLCRQLSFNGVIFDTLEANISDEARLVYDRLCVLVSLTENYMKTYLKSNTRISTNFYSSCQRLFLSLIVSFKIETTVNAIIKEKEEGRSSIVTVQNTGESQFKVFLRHGKIGEPYSVTEYELRNLLASVQIVIGTRSFLYRTDGSILKIISGGKNKFSNESDDSDFETEDTSDCDETNSGSDSYYGNYEDINTSSCNSPLQKRRRLDSSSSSTTSNESNSTADNDSESNGETDEDSEDCTEREGVPFSTRTDFTLYEAGYGLNQLPKHLAWSGKEMESSKVSAFISHEAMEVNVVETISAERIDKDTDDQKCREREHIKKLFHQIVPFLPVNPLDELLDRLKGKGICVIELTGRTRTYSRCDNSKEWEALTRETSTQAKVEGVKSFMETPGSVAIISDASSVGISLHAKAGCQNSLPRTQILLELPWGADQLVQQCGRSHRSGQTAPPKFIVVKTKCEIRKIATLSRRLAQLGAVTNAQSRGNQILSGLADDVCSKKGAEIINQLLDGDCKFEGIKRVSSSDSIEKRMKGIGKVFNSLLCKPLSVQEHFLENMTIRLDRGKSRKTSFVEFPKPGTDVTVVLTSTIDFSNVQIHTFVVDRIQTYPEQIKNPKFFMKNFGSFNLPLILCDTTLTHWLVRAPYQRSVIRVPINSTSKFIEIDEAETRNLWDSQVAKLQQSFGCMHKVFMNIPTCTCDSRFGRKNVYLLTGDLFGVWYEIQKAFQDGPGEDEEGFSERYIDMKVAKFSYSYGDQKSTHLVGIMFEETMLEKIQSVLSGD